MCFNDKELTPEEIIRQREENRAEQAVYRKLNARQQAAQYLAPLTNQLEFLKWLSYVKVLAEYLECRGPEDHIFDDGK